MFRPSFIIIAWICVTIRTCHSFHFEISLANKPGHNGTVHFKLACRPTGESSENKGNQSVLWEGSQFGSSERSKLVFASNGQLLVPDIRVNSSERYRCSLVSPLMGQKEKKLLRKRILRQLSAPVAPEFGTCAPGYRLDRNLCYPCFPGSYSSGQETVCYLCPKHFYMSREAADSCWPCPDGKKTLNEGADSEDECFIIDKEGKPVKAVSTKWLVVGICIAISVVASIIVTAILANHLQKKKPKQKPRKVIQVQGRKPIPPPKVVPYYSTDEEGHIYESISDRSLSDEGSHIYSRIDSLEEDGYEVPRKTPSYEEPIRRKADDDYTEIVPETPPRRQIIKKWPPSHDSSDYEVPMKRNPDKTQYIELVPEAQPQRLPGKLNKKWPPQPHDSGYEVPIRRQPEGYVQLYPDDQHIYEQPIQPAHVKRIKAPKRK